MDQLDDILSAFDTQSETKSGSTKKRKWREIEQLKEKFALEKELKIYEDSLEHMLNEF